MHDAEHSKDAGPTDGPTQMERDRPREPGLTEIESARTLQAEAKQRLIDRDLDDEEIRKAADEYIAEGGSGDVEDFIDWVLKGLEREGAVDG
jgi:hypothetical protein